MPYSGADDKNLPENIKKLPALDTELKKMEKAPVVKNDGGVDFTASDYADVPDDTKPSTWKLRLAEGKSGNFTVAQVARAITAMQPGGFRGQQVELGSPKEAVAAKITSAINKIAGADDPQKKNLQERLGGVKMLERDKKDGPPTDDCGCEADSPPLGGAQSFAEADTFDIVEEQTEAIRDQTKMFRQIIENIMGDEGLTLSQKAVKVAAVSSELSVRVANPPEFKTEEDEKVGKRINKSWLDQIKSSVGVLTKLLSWGDYSDEELAAATEKVVTEEDLPPEGGFKVYRDKVGGLRWLAFSSNAFRDREGEIFGTKALESAVEEADKTGNHGTLRLYHVPSSDVGVCDFQEIVGRVLVESGVFDTTERGRKAAAYFEETTDEHGISIGYRYRKGDRSDGVYDWVEIFERSIAPKDAVANSWTTFNTVGGKMDERKKAFLTKVLGEDLTNEVILSAETLTKDLEGQSVAYKVKGVSEAVAAVTDPEEKAAVEVALADLDAALPEDKKDTADDSAAVAADSEQAAPDALVQLKEAIAPLTEAIAGVDARLAKIEEAQKTQAAEIEGLKTSDDEKVVSLFRARGKAMGTAPSADSGNTVDADSEIAKAVKAAGEGATDPTTPYIEDLLQGVGVQR